MTWKIDPNAPEVTTLGRAISTGKITAAGIYQCLMKQSIEQREQLNLRLNENMAIGQMMLDAILKLPFANEPL